VSANPLRRFLIYRTAKSRQHLCVCAARDGRHALRIARQMFLLERTAFAVPEAQRQRLLSPFPPKPEGKSAR
jgi:hypothetical protein